MPDTNPFILLCDIGGTHARLGIASATDNFADIHHIEKFKTTDFEGLEDTASQYFKNNHITAQNLKAVYSASAVRPRNGVVQFDTGYKLTPWRIAPHDIASYFDIAIQNIHIFLDTHAQFLALESTSLAANEKIELKSGHATDTDTKDEQKLLISIGTGLGHAYGNLKTGHFVPTFGGHMPPLTNTPEHAQILAFIQNLRDENVQLIAEDILSGRGFYNLYLYSCAAKNITPSQANIYELAENLANTKPTPEIIDTVRLYCEFLGLYVHMTAMCTHSFQSCTIIGGLARTLIETGLFNREAFAKNINLNMVSVVKTQLENMPVTLVTKPHLSLYGLLYAHIQNAKDDI